MHTQLQQPAAHTAGVSINHTCNLQQQIHQHMHTAAAFCDKLCALLCTLDIQTGSSARRSRQVELFHAGMTG